MSTDRSCFVTSADPRELVSTNQDKIHVNYPVYPSEEQVSFNRLPVDFFDKLC